MTFIAYLQCSTGIAGDMCLGALVDVGVPLDYLTQQLGKLKISREFHLRAECVQRNGQAATKVHVELLTPDTSHDSIQAASATTSISNSDTSPQTVSPQAHPHSHDHDHHHSHHDHPSTHPPDTDVPRNVSTHPPIYPSTHPHSPTRHLPEIEHLIRSADLPNRAATWSLAVFHQLAEAEGSVHGIPASQVHFHEVGATDAIVDIVGTCLGLDYLGIEQLYCSPMPTGGGTVWAAHGRLPVPTPAVLKLWEMRQVPIYSNGIDRELVTPTGAAIATTLATEFGDPPAMRLQKVGLGAGSHDLSIPNILRLWIGESDRQGTQVGVRQATPIVSHPAAEGHPLQETITVLETQIDDASPQAIAYASERLFEAGAVEVFSQAIAMKKSRLGTLLTVICPPEVANKCESILFRETTTLGVRRLTQMRTILHREIQTVQTEFGAVRVKVARRAAAAAVQNAQPEYEDCAQLARQSGVSWREVQRKALECWHAQS